MFIIFFKDEDFDWSKVKEEQQNQQVTSPPVEKKELTKDELKKLKKETKEREKKVRNIIFFIDKNVGKKE